MSELQAAGRRIPSVGVCARYGITRRTLGRWINDDKLSFPASMMICGRHYWDIDLLDAFDKRCVRNIAAKEAA